MAGDAASSSSRRRPSLRVGRTTSSSPPPSSPSASSIFDAPIALHPPSTPITVPSSDPANEPRCRYPYTPSTIHHDAPVSPTTPTAGAGLGAPCSSSEAAAPLSPSYDRSRRRTMKLVRAKRKVVTTEAIEGEPSASRRSNPSALDGVQPCPSGASGLTSPPPRAQSSSLASPTTPREQGSPVTPRARRTSKLLVRGNVTPSRAAPIFRIYQQRLGINSGASASSRKVGGRRGLRKVEAARLGKAQVDSLSMRKRARADASSDEDDFDGWQGARGAEPLASSDEEEDDDDEWAQPSSFGRARLSFAKRCPSMLQATLPHDDPSSALLMMRQGGTHGLRASRLGASRLLAGAVSQQPFLSTFTPTPERRFVPSLESLSLYEARHSEDESARLAASLGPSHPYAHPLCAAYSNESRSADNYRAQWLAVGSSEGTVVLFNTLIDPMALEQPHDQAPPYWQACSGSIFELAWRGDDRVLATGGSDYMVKTWDTETFAHLGTFGGSRGSPRSLVWDSSSTTGSLLLSGGRDGAIHLFDTRVHTRSSASATPQERAPVMSLWAAHTVLPTRPATGPGSRGGRVGRSSNSSAQSRQRQQQQDRALKGVTSMTYVPGRGDHVVASAGCATGVVKIWDLRHMSRPTETLVPSLGDASSQQELLLTAASRTPQAQPQARKPFGDAASAINMLSVRLDRSGNGVTSAAGDSTLAASDKVKGRAKRVRKIKSKPAPLGGEDDPIEMAPVDESADVTSSGDGWNRSPHGISSLVASSTTLFAASTDGRIYQLPLASLSEGNSAQLTRFGAASPLFHPSQRGNTLFSRLALHDDERTLALGCNSGDITLWDVKNAGLVKCGHAASSSAQMPHVLRGGHSREINSLAWAHGPSGPTLASISDDLGIRVWRPDRKAAELAGHSAHSGQGVATAAVGLGDIF